jgi:dUTP pyrophosphatase
MSHINVEQGNAQRIRGFEEVANQFKKYGTKVTLHGKDVVVFPETQLPVRADKGSAGYDFYTPVDVLVLPNHTEVVWTNVKAYMGESEVLQLFVRSSVGIKDNVTLANGTGIIDASYYGNAKNDGNIGIALRNNSGQAKEYKVGDRIAQGVFLPFLVADEDVALKETRDGGIGSSNL